MWKVVVDYNDGFGEIILADGLDYEMACGYANEWSAKYGAPAYVEEE